MCPRRGLTVPKKKNILSEMWIDQQDMSLGQRKIWVPWTKLQGLYSWRARSFKRVHMWQASHILLLLFCHFHILIYFLLDFLKGLWARHHFQLWEGIFYARWADTWWRNSRNKQEKCFEGNFGSRSPSGGMKIFPCCSFHTFIFFAQSGECLTKFDCYQ